MLEANDMVEAKLAEIRERKLHEMKRMFAAKMHEGVGGLTKAEVEARKKAGYKKASDVLGDPRKEMTPIAGHRFKKVKKKISEETLDEMRAPGEVPGSDERKQDAAKLRKLRQDLAGVGQDRRIINKPYLAKRKAQMKTTVDDEEQKKKSSIADRLASEKKRWTDRLDSLSARHLSRHDVKGGKSTWERSAGGKAAAIVKPVVKTAGGAIGALSRELGSIGFSNLE